MHEIQFASTINQSHKTQRHLNAFLILNFELNLNARQDGIPLQIGYSLSYLRMVMFAIHVVYVHDDSSTSF